MPTRLAVLKTAAGAAAALAVLALPAFAQVENECGSSLTAADVPEILRLKAAGAWDPPSGLPTDIAAAPIAIPVTVHVLRQDNGTGAIDPARITQAFADLNVKFVPAFIYFYKCGPTRFIDSDDLYELDSWAERDQLVGIEWVPNTINLYFVADFDVDGEGFCGQATLSHWSTQAVILNNGCAGVASNPSTVPHEFGHFFDLYHTHDNAVEPECADGSNGDTGGDLVADTPADPKLGDSNMSGCTYVGTEIDPCGDPYSPDPTNLMCYAGKLCRTHFSPGQISRIRATLFNRRPELIGGGCASTLGSFTGTPRPEIPDPPFGGKPVVFARRACDAASGPCRTASDGGTTDDFITASIEVANSTPVPLRLNLRIEVDLDGLVPGGGKKDVTAFFRPVGGGAPIANPVTFAPGRTVLDLDVKKAIGPGLLSRFPANVPFVARLEVPGGRGLLLDYSSGLLGIRPAAGYYDDCVVEEHLLARAGAQVAGDALVVRFAASDLPDAAAGWDVRGAQIVGGEIGGSGLAGLARVELRVEDPANPGQPDMSAGGLLRSTGPIAFGAAAPSTEYADFADLVLSPPPANPPDLFVLAYLNPGDTLSGAATAISASSGSGGAVLVGNSSILLGGATPLVPIPDRDLMIRLDLNGALSD